jgi:ATP-dependent DNA ligase
MRLPFDPPLEPMLAKPVGDVPEGPGWLFEPKWDGFRAIVFRDGDEVYIQSRDLKPLNRYFPELEGPLRASLPERCVVDGEIVIAGRDGLEFEALLLRIHPAASRVAMLAAESPASFVAWDLLALGDRDLRTEPQEVRRATLESSLGRAADPAVHLTPATRDAAIARDWFARFEGAGLDGVIAKPLGAPYQPGKRAMLKIKHLRTADCVVAGFRWHKVGEGTVGSLLLGLYDEEGTLHHVGITASFTMDRRRALARELEPLREGAMDSHPWSNWAEWAAEYEARGQRVPGATSRWNRGRDLSWEPLRLERVCEVAYDHLQGSRFRHGTTFRRWRPDKQPADCRYDQLEETAPFELSRIFGAETAG